MRLRFSHNSNSVVIVLPRLLSCACAFYAILQGPHHVVAGSNVLASVGQIFLSVLCVSPAVTAVLSSGAARIVAKLREMRLYVIGPIIQLSV